MDNKLKSMFSLCKRSGNLLSGDVQVTNALSKKLAHLIIIIDDASENTVKTFTNKSHHYKIPCIKFGDRVEINYAIGTENKAVFAVTDENFAKRIQELITLEQESTN